MADFIVKSRKKKDYTQFTARIETDVLENVRKIVNENNLISINELINESLKFAFKNMKIMEDDTDI